MEVEEAIHFDPINAGNGAPLGDKGIGAEICKHLAVLVESVNCIMKREPGGACVAVITGPCCT